MYCVMVWKRVKVMCVYFVVLWQLVIGMVCVLCCGLAACHMYGACIVW